MDDRASERGRGRDREYVKREPPEPPAPKQVPRAIKQEQRPRVPIKREPGVGIEDIDDHPTRGRFGEKIINKAGAVATAVETVAGPDGTPHDEDHNVHLRTVRHWKWVTTQTCGEILIPCQKHPCNFLGDIHICWAWEKGSKTRKRGYYLSEAFTEHPSHRYASQMTGFKPPTPPPSPPRVAPRRDEEAEVKSGDGLDDDDDDDNDEDGNLKAEPVAKHENRIKLQSAAEVKAEKDDDH